MKYKKPLLIQSELGDLFGTTSHKIGRALVDLDLRTTSGYPTKRAIDEGFCRPLQAAMNYTNYGWNPDKTVPELIKAGLKLVDEPPTWIVESSKLQGPFTLSCNNPTVVVNSEGDFVAKTSSANHSMIISRLLDLAHKHGTIERLLAQCN